MLFAPNDLPPATRDRLARLSRGEPAEGTLVVSTSRRTAPIVWTILGGGAAIVTLVGVARADPLAPVPLYFLAAIAAAMLFLGLAGLVPLVREKLAAIRPCVVVTPAVVVHADVDAISFHRVADYASARSTSTGRRELRFADRSCFEVDYEIGIPLAEAIEFSRKEGGPVGSDLLEGLDPDRELDRAPSPAARLAALVVIAAVASGGATIETWRSNLATLEASRWKLAASAKLSRDAQDYVAWGELAKRASLPSFIATAAPLAEHLDEAKRRVEDLSFAEARSPEALRAYLARYRGGVHEAEARVALDDTVFAAANASRSAKALRAYLTEFPAGRHEAEVRPTMRKLYEAAEHDWLARGGGDASAKAAIATLCAWMRDGHEGATVRVVVGKATGPAANRFERALAAELQGQKTTLGQKPMHVVPVGPSFTPDKNMDRETKVVGAVIAAIKSVIGELIPCEAGDEEGSPRFVIDYQVQPSGEIYLRENALLRGIEGAHEPDVYVGIEIAFTCSLEVPGKGVVHSYALLARPPATVTFKTQRNAFDFDKAPRPDEVYDAMADTAFDDFQKGLVQAFGLK